MTKGKRLTGIVFLVLAAAAALFFYHEYNRKPADMTSVSATEKTGAQELVHLFTTDEQRANKRYLGKPIDITGNIASIDSQNDTLVSVILGKADDMHRVSCLLDKNHQQDIKRFKAGDAITLRGVCTGYLMDVELNRCVVLPQ